MTVNGTGPFTEWSSIETYESDLTETHVPGKPTITNSKHPDFDFESFRKLKTKLIILFLFSFISTSNKQ